MRKKININLKGFTIIELLVSVSVLALISGIFLANYRSANRQAVLNLAARQLASNIRLAQTYTMGLREFKGAVPPGGWGLRFFVDYYLIMADKDGTGELPAGGPELEADLYQKIDLPENIRIKKYCSTDPSAPADCTGIDTGGELSVLFIPPNPTVKIKSETGVCSSACLLLTDIATNAEKHIKINSLGLINID